MEKRRIYSLWAQWGGGLAWSVGFGPLGVQRLCSQGGARLQFSFGKLGQIGHDGVLIHVGIHNLLWGDDLKKDGTESPCERTLVPKRGGPVTSGPHHNL